MTNVKKFIIHFSHFFTGNALSVLLGLITFPILTRILSQEQYGILGLVTTTVLILTAISKAGLSNGIIRFYEEYNNSPDQRLIFSSTVFTRGILVSGVITFLYMLLFPFIYNALHIQKGYLICFMLMGAYVFIRPLNIIVFNILRVNGKTLYMTSVQLAGRIISVCLSLLLLIFIIREIHGYFIGHIIAEFAVSITLFVWFFKNYSVNLKKVSNRLMLDLLKFGTPLLFYELSFLLLSYADRYMILAFYSESELGLYSVGYNLAMYISDIVTFSLSYAIVPLYVKIYTNEGRRKTEEFLKESFRYVLIGIIPICFGYYAVSEDLIDLLASHKYLAASAFSPIILFSSVLIGLSNLLNAGLYLEKKAWTMLAINLFAVCLNILLNLMLLQRYNVMGAAVSTFFACVSLIILTIMTSYRYIVIRLNMKSFLLNIMLSLLMVYVLSHIDSQIPWQNLLVKVPLGILIISLGIILFENDIANKVKTNIDILIKSRHPGEGRGPEPM